MIAVADTIPDLPDLPDEIVKIAAYDCETEKFRPGKMAPPIVVASIGGAAGEEVVLGRHAPDRLRDILESDLLVAGANLAYDCAAAAQADPTLHKVIFRALRKGKIHDVLLGEALHAIFHGHLGMTPLGDDLKNSEGKVVRRYNLFNVTGMALGRWDAKDEAAFRKSYAMLAPYAVDRWPAEAKAYLFDDVRNPVEIAQIQLGLGEVSEHEWNEFGYCPHCHTAEGDGFSCISRPRVPHGNIEDLATQCLSDYALKLGTYWSLRTDPDKVAKLAEHAHKKQEAFVTKFKQVGWIRPDGSEDQCAVKKAVVKAYGGKSPCPRCLGKGKVEKWEDVDCRGEKIRGRYKGCLGVECYVCGGARFVRALKSVVTCRVDADGGCDGSGYDLSELPMLRRTETGGVSTDRDAKLESGDEDLADYGNDEWQKSLTTYLPYLQTGVDGPLKIEVNALVESGRPSYAGSTLLQMPRKGLERECVRARGAWCGSPVEYVLGSSDYQAGELCALSVMCFWLFGYSRMMDAINEAGEPGILHADLASQVLGIPLPEFLERLKNKDKQAKDFRQASKPYHFGRPARMGSPKIVSTNRKKSAGFTVCEDGPAVNDEGQPGYWGIRFCILVEGKKSCGGKKITEWKGHPCDPVCEDCCNVVENILGPAYVKAYPEIKDYHRWGARMVDKKEKAPTYVWDADADAPKIVRLRGGCGMSDLLNNGFQSMLAVIGKDAHANVVEECYTGERQDGSHSELAGCRVPLFLYDECFSELIADTAHLSGPRIADIMMASGKRLAPQVTWKVDTALMSVWLKGAEAVYDNGKLIPWVPK